MKKMQIHSKRGFSLIEVMVVIVILGMLATVVAVGVMDYLAQARTTKAKMDLE